MITALFCRHLTRLGPQNTVFEYSLLDMSVCHQPERVIRKRLEKYYKAALQEARKARECVYIKSKTIENFSVKTGYYLIDETGKFETWTENGVAPESFVRAKKYKTKSFN